MTLGKLPTNHGERNRAQQRVPDVETMACSTGGTHRLTNSAQRGGLVTACVGCGASWSELDALARGGAA